MADRVVGNLAIRLDFDGAKFEQGITKAKRELSTYNKATQASTRIAKADNYEKGKSALALNNMQVQYKGLQGTLQSHADMNKRLIEQGKENSSAIASNENAMRNYEVQMWELNEQYKQFQQEMFTANSGFTKMGDTMTKVGGAMQTFGGGLTEIGTGITKIGAMASASLGLVAKMAIEFEDGMVQVQKTTNASAEEMAVFEEQIRGLALVMPLAVGELAEVAALAGQLGIAQEDIAYFTETVSKLGTATNLSAEEAGNALARFQNITGSSIDTLENLSSAIVHLGNNFATQESEIINLGMMLAGSMTTVGAAETDILGLSAAMSALGITAERGGSSMSKFFVDLASYVSSGADELEVFAEVAGMSKEAFSELFTQDSMAAVEAFIVGLGGVGEKGGDMLAVLDELGIGEVRLRDTVLRLANGHEVLSEALDYSKQGFEENIALTEEYELLAGTTASQIQIAKNQLQDLAITAGQELLPAIMDLLNNSDGIIDMLKGAVDWFVSLDDEMKQNLVKWSAMAIVIGPVVSGLGNVISGLGGLVTMGGGALTTIGKLEGAFKAKLAGGLVEATTASQGLAGAKGIGGVVTAITGGSGLLWALGLAGVAFAGWTWWDKWGEDAWEAGERTRKWGTDVDETTAGVLEEIQEVQGTFGLMTQGVGANSSEMVGDFQTIGQSIEDDINARLQAMEEYLGAMPENLRNAQAEILADEQERLEKSKEQIVVNNEEIANIQERASKANREITATEMAYINQIHQDSLDEYLGVLNISAEEEQNIRSALSGDIENIQTQQVNNMIRLLMDEQNALAQQKNAQLRANEELAGGNKKMLEQLNQNTEDYYDAIGTTGERTLQDLVAMNEDYIYMYNLYTGELLALDQQNYDYNVQMNKDLVASWAESHSDMRKESEEYASAQELLVDRTRVGAETWNNMIIESGGNMEVFKEKVMETAQTAEGWNHIRFQIHEANLDSNARLIIGEAAIANGWWEGMAWEDKQALLKDNFSETVYLAIVEAGIWDNLTIEEKTAVLNNEFSDTVIQSMMDSGTWNDLTFEEQRAVLTTNSPDTLIQVLKDFNLWDSLNPVMKDLLLDNRPVLKATDEAERDIDEFGNMKVPVPVLRARDGVTSEVIKAQQAINQLRGKTVYIDAITRAGGSASSRRFIESGGSFGYQRGTNHHEGGLAMVNDQMGSLYRELITLPDGQSFIPKGRNVVLDLPEGSKVLRAALTKMKIPKYRDGIGYSKPQTQQIISGSNTDMSQTNSLLNTLIQLVGQGQVINLDGDQVGKTIYPRIDSTMNRNMQRNQIMNMGG